MATRREELTREAARLFAERGYHGTSIGDVAKAMGVQKGSLYAHMESKQDLLYEAMRDGAQAFHGALDEIPDDLKVTERLRLALRAHLRTVSNQLDVATVFTREWRYLEGERRDEIVTERRRAQDPLPLGQDAHQLGVPVHLDELDELRPVLVGHPVAGLDLSPALHVLDELLRARVHLDLLPNDR